MRDTVLSVNDLRTYFYLRSGTYKAVDGLNFSVERGETLGIVGESGSGKSVSMQSILGLIPQPPGKVLSGSAMFGGMDLLKIGEKALRQVRGKRIGMIFQDPMTSLNPYLKVSTQLTEVLYEHEKITRKEARRRAIEVLEQVGIPDAAKRIDAYPHQFSGGMRQRVMIAMAIIGRPELLIADEPTTALDVTIQAQILELLKDIQRANGMSLIFITHDLGVVAGISDNILVMYAGKMVEYGSANDIFYRASHPYTNGLLNSIPNIANPKGQALLAIPGLPPDPSRLPQGCSFAERCSFVSDVCRSAEMIPARKAKEKHVSHCHKEAAVC